LRAGGSSSPRSKSAEGPCEQILLVTGCCMNRWTIGDVTITRVVEHEGTSDLSFILTQATPEAIVAVLWLRPHFADDRARGTMSVHSFVITSQGQRIVV